MLTTDILNAVTIAILIGLAAYSLYSAFAYVNRKDKDRNRISQCPPHAWDPQYRDPTEAEKELDPAITHVYVGLRCGKCKRTPGTVDRWVDFGPWGMA